MDAVRAVVPRVEEDRSLAGELTALAALLRAGGTPLTDEEDHA